MTARKSLNNHVSQLRQYLRGLGGVELLTVASGYLLKVSGDDVDVFVFRRLLAEAGLADERRDWRALAERTDEALALWRDTPLVDLPGLADVEAPFVAELGQARMKALEWQVAARLRLGEHQRLVGDLTALIGEFPLHEPFYVQLMRCLLLRGRRAEGLAVFRRLRRVLVEELGLEPGPEAAAVQRELMAAPGSPVVSGRQNWAAGSTQEHGIGPDQAAERGGDRPVACQLPPGVVDFSGRSREAEQLCSYLTPPEDAAAGPGVLRVGAIHGIGGAGKTALAVHVAHRISKHYPDGSLYVDLRGVDETPVKPGDVLGTMLRDLGMPDALIPADEHGRTSAFRSLLAGRRVLLLLDNARDAAQVRPLLPGSGSCAVLVTSRRMLTDLAGALSLSLDRLTEAEACALLGTIVGEQRVAREPEAAAALVGYCSGLPLALRIAGARLASRPSWSLADLAARLADHRRRLDEFRVGDLAVRSSFRLGYDALKLAGRDAKDCPARVFRYLALAPGPDITPAAAGALLGLPSAEAEAVLEELVDVCLLESPAPGRYSLHDLLGFFAAERAEAEIPPELRAAAVDRLTRWYLRGLVEAGALLFPSHDRPRPRESDQEPWVPGFTGFDDALAWCDVEHPALVGAARAAAEYGFHDTAWRMHGFGWGYFNLRHLWEDWQVLADIALESTRALGEPDPYVAATVLTAQGALFLRLDRLPQARQTFLEALAVRRRIGDISGQLACLSNLGTVLMRENRYEDAARAYRRALALTGSADQRGHEANLSLDLGIALRHLGRWSEAREHLERAADLTRDSGNKFVQADILQETGLVEVYLNKPDEAIPTLNRALAMARSIRSPQREAFVLAALSLAEQHRGRTDEARAHAGAMRALLPRLAEHMGRSICALLPRNDPDLGCAAQS